MNDDIIILINKYKKDIERMEKQIKNEKDIWTIGHLRNNIRFLKKLVIEMEGG